jgi:EF hand
MVDTPSNRGNDMKSSRLMIAGAVAALLPLAGMAQTPSDPPQKGATFESLDANGDGKISKAEAAANADVSAQFSRYDQNGDGFIERAEVNSTNEPPPAGEQPPQQ